MIISRLAGGIGNQMFHYAAARGSQRVESERIVLDTHVLRPLETAVDKIDRRTYALWVFPNLKASVIDARLDRLLYDERLLSRVRRKVFKARTETVRQRYLELVTVGPRRKAHLWLLGNFQSEEHFSKIREQLLVEFTFAAMDAENEATKAKILASPEPVAIHLRRGDYQLSRNKGVYDSLNMDYYYGALRQLNEQVAVEALDAFVFSDDIPWARANFHPPGLRLHHVTGNDAENSWKDMNLMSCCRHHIIANSSFSWWGAWLSVRGGLKFLPRHWFRPATYAYDIHHIAPKAWHVVDYELH